MPKVSVIVPIYGVEKYIEQCAKSLMEQTLDDVEYIFIDDCTPDNSMVLLKRVLDNYPHRKSNVVICHNEKNMGQARTRRKGIMMATGDYVIHCDSDDWVEEAWLESLYGEVVRCDCDIAWCGFDSILSDGSTRFFANKASNSIEDFLIKLEIGQKWGALWLHLVNRKIVQSDKISWPDWNYCEDLSLVFQYVALARGVAYVDKGLYNYRHNLDSITSQRSRQGIIRNVEGEIKASFQGLSVSQRLGLGRSHRANILSRIFKAKARLWLAASGSRDFCKLWHDCSDKLGLADIWKSSLSVREKIVMSTILLNIYPLIKR